MMGELLAHDELAGEGTAGRRAVVAVDAAVGQRRELPAVVLLTCRAHVAAEAGVDDVADGDGVADCESSHLRRSEEHTSELQSRGHLVCRLLLHNKKPVT